MEISRHMTIRDVARHRDVGLGNDQGIPEARTCRGVCQAHSSSTCDHIAIDENLQSPRGTAHNGRHDIQSGRGGGGPGGGVGGGGGGRVFVGDGKGAKEILPFWKRLRGRKAKSRRGP